MPSLAPVRKNADARHISYRFSILRGHHSLGRAHVARGLRHPSALFSRVSTGVSVHGDSWSTWAARNVGHAELYRSQVRPVAYHCGMQSAMANIKCSMSTV